jgi:hypothetical protein
MVLATAQGESYETTAVRGPARQFFISSKQRLAKNLSETLLYVPVA